LTTSYDLGALKEPDEVGADPREIILPRPGFRTILANRDFRLIWSAQVASQLADKFLMFALLILTYSISRASTHGAALFLAYTFPSVFLSPLAGVYADRHDKKRLMFFTNAIRGGLILLIPPTSNMSPGTSSSSSFCSRRSGRSSRQPRRHRSPSSSEPKS